MKWRQDQVEETLKGVLLGLQCSVFAIALMILAMVS